jgi:GTP cyclohydrolase I
MISDIIKARLAEKSAPYLSTDNISEFINFGEKEQLINEVALKMEAVLQSLVIDTISDHNTQDTARRVAKMFINETFAGRYNPAPSITTFPNAKTYDQMYVTGPITVQSTCAHHFKDITGVAYIGVFPGKNVMGLSKFSRIVEWYSSRPTIQEELTVQIADHISEITQAEGVAVIIKAEHGCLTTRGIRAHESDFSTSVVRGIFRESPMLKQEFFNILAGMKGWKN